MAGRLLHATIRLTQCCDTHHRFALDALPLVQTDAGKRLVQMILRYYWRYLTGATDPDSRFCDFQNHVIHARDGFWGGAPRVAHQWYDRLQRYLATDRYSDAAHAAGVLSHYFTDPLQPLHTQHDVREKILHGPIEWSVHRSYRSILRGWKQNELRIVFQLSDSFGWLGEAILHGARYANRKFEILMDDYDLGRSINQPAAALTADAHAALSELFGLAITGWARVIERAASEAEELRGQPLPSFSTALPTIVAMLRVPTRLTYRWLDNRRRRFELAQLIEEFLVTGTLKQHLPHDVDIVHRVVRIHEDEQRWKRERQRRLASKQTVINVDARSTIPFPAKQSNRRAA